MKTRYIDLMEKALSAYSDEHIESYYRRVQENGLTEHGFPRLTSNIGVLIAHGRRKDLFPLFLGMMDLCCEQIPRVKAANDFTVREIITCIMEMERSGSAPAEKIAEWKKRIGSIRYQDCYTVYAREPEDDVANWALFTAASEYMRQYIGVAETSSFVELQIENQLRRLDENGMYRDPNEPMVYDMVGRVLFSFLLHFGYAGKYRERMDAQLKKAGIINLGMQSVSGEIPYGGRSAQFLHNEATLAIIFEYEANRYARLGDLAMAGRFKRARRLALDNVELWMSKPPIRHVKNRYSLETKHGCENYAYFDKYMITAASNLYLAYLIADDEIEEREEITRPYVLTLSRYFHKTFLRQGDWFLEFDTMADPHYDASGLGRVHRRGAPSALCLSLPIPATPSYTSEEGGMDASLAVGYERGGEAVFATGRDTVYEKISESADSDSASVCFRTVFEGGHECVASYRLTDGVSVRVTGEGKQLFMLPAFAFDGEVQTEIRCEDGVLSVSYEGWTVLYETDGRIRDLCRYASNRNGRYRIFYAEGDESLHVSIRILKK